MESDRPDHALAAVPLFLGLPLDALDALARSSRVRRYPKGQIICSEGDPGDSLLVIEEGQVRVSRFTPGGQEVVLAVFNAPAALGELALIDGEPRSATVTASSPVTIRIVGQTAFLALVEREPAIARALLRSLAGMVRATNERLADVLSLDVSGRLAKWLLRHARPAPPAVGAVVPFTISQSDLAAELGTTRVSINKALKGLEAGGAIAVERDRIVLLRPDALRGYGA